jgi:hypothetical protein
VPAALALEPRALRTHFRFASLGWEPIAGRPGTVAFHLRLAARRDSSSAGAAVRVGEVVTDTTAMDRLEFGDGRVLDPVRFRVVAVTPDAFVAEAVRADDSGFVAGLEHTYDGAGPFTARYRGNNRLGGLKNDAMTPYQVTARVDLATGGAGPAVALGPVVAVPDNTVVRFAIPAFDPDGDAVRVRLATPGEASDAPGYAPPPGLAVTPDGLVTWDLRDGVRDTRPGDLWTAQFVVEELDRAGAVRGTGSVDLLLAVQASVPAAPTFDGAPAGPTPLLAGVPLSVALGASDPDGGAPAAIELLNPPPGLVPVTLLPSPGSPARAPTVRLDWTPTAAQASRPWNLVVVARDANGRATPRTIRFVPGRNAPPVARANGPYGPGASVTLSAAGSIDPDGAIVRYEWDLAHDGSRFDADATGAAATIAPAAAFAGPLDRAIALRVTDDLGAATIATATLRLRPGVEGALDPASDTGTSPADRITRDARPRLLGRAYPGATVRVYAQPAGTSGLVDLGAAVARADGTWSLLARAGALRDGAYGLVATATEPTTGRVGGGALGPLVLDTVGPRVAGVAARAATGELVVTLADDRAGLDPGALVDPAAYRLVHLLRPNRPLAVSRVTPGPAGAGNATRTVVVQFDGGRAFRPNQPHRLTLRAGGLADLAGNALEGGPGGDFTWRFVPPPVAARGRRPR